MANPIDLHVGRRLRQRRCLLGMTQQQLANAVGIKFQQIQKYESGANRISASRLWSLAKALQVPVSYFFDGLNNEAADMEDGKPAIDADVFSEKETIDLLRAYYGLQERPRRRLLDLAKAISDAE